MTAVDPVASFVDTNIFVYAMADDDPKKRSVAQNLIETLAEVEMLHTSTQVLQEIYSVLTTKVKRKLSAHQALSYLDRIARSSLMQIDYPAIYAAAQLSSSHVISFWDALIVVAAQRVHARRLYTEDLQHGRRFGGLEIVNPFRKA